MLHCFTCVTGSSVTTLYFLKDLFEIHYQYIRIHHLLRSHTYRHYKSLLLIEVDGGYSILQFNCYFFVRVKSHTTHHNGCSWPHNTEFGTVGKPAIQGFGNNWHDFTPFTDLLTSILQTCQFSSWQYCVVLVSLHFVRLWQGRQRLRLGRGKRFSPGRRGGVGTGDPNSQASQSGWNSEHQHSDVNSS